MTVWLIYKIRMYKITWFLSLIATRQKKLFWRDYYNNFLNKYETFCIYRLSRKETTQVVEPKFLFNRKRKINSALRVSKIQKITLQNTKIIRICFKIIVLIYRNLWLSLSNIKFQTLKIPDFVQIYRIVIKPFKHQNYDMCLLFLIFKLWYVRT